MNNTIPVLLLTGYLGSGKTTLLNRILTNRRGIRFAVIVNDIGEVNIDADLIRKGGVVDGGDDLVALQNGCICCTLQTDLVRQLTDLAAQPDFDYIVIEASGICEPEPIARSICSIPSLPEGQDARRLPVLDCIVTVVDALRMADEFGAGEALVSKHIDEEDIENLVIQQIEFCNIVLLNKASEVSADVLSQVRRIVATLNPGVEIIDTDYGEVDLDRLLHTHRFNYDRAATSARWIAEIEGHHHDDEDDDDHGHHGHCCHHHHEHGEECHCHHHHHGEGEAEEYGISTFVYYRRRPFDLNRFDYFVGKDWPRSVIRCKGLVYFDINRDMSYLFEQAGSQKKVTPAGQWFATAPADELAEMMAADPTLAADWDPEYGDRMIKLVFIGRDMDRAAITAALDACLEEK